MRRLKKKQLWYTKSFPVSWYTPIEDEAWCNCSWRPFKILSSCSIRMRWNTILIFGIFLINNLRSHTFLKLILITFIFCRLFDKIYVNDNISTLFGLAKVICMYLFKYVYVLFLVLTIFVFRNIYNKNSSFISSLNSIVQFKNF